MRLYSERRNSGKEGEAQSPICPLLKEGGKAI